MNLRSIQVGLSVALLASGVLAAKAAHACPAPSCPVGSYRPVSNLWQSTSWPGTVYMNNGQSGYGYATGSDSSGAHYLGAANASTGPIGATCIDAWAWNGSWQGPFETAVGYGHTNSWQISGSPTTVGAYFTGCEFLVK
jgi:hypothetical protein